MDLLKYLQAGYQNIGNCKINEQDYKEFLDWGQYTIDVPISGR